MKSDRYKLTKVARLHRDGAACLPAAGRNVWTLLAILFSLTGNALAQSPVMLTISTQSSGYKIPNDFAGLSFETGSELLNRNGVSGYLFSPTNSAVITLFQNIGLHNLRLGGGSVDGTKAAVPTDTGIDNLFAFANAVGNLDVIYSVRLLNGSSSVDATTAQYIWQHYRSRLSALAIGNEPDWNSYHYPPYGTGSDPAITNYTSYLADWRVFAAAITNAVPGAVFVGPDTGSYTTSTYYQGESWTQHFADDEKSSGIVAIATQHYYVGGNPGSTTGPQATSNMLSQAWDVTEYPWLYSNNLAPVVAVGMPYRMTEANDYLTGITNASNAYASALWALDFMHWWAAHGCAGVNFHNKSWLLTDTIYLDPAGHFQINPKAYGIKAFDLGCHGSVEPVTIGNSDQLNLTAYAVGTASNLFVTIINKENGAGARNAVVTIAPSAITSASVSAMFLTAPNGNIAATNGLALGGAAITNNASWLGQWTPLAPMTNGQCLLTVAAASAAILQIIPALNPPPLIITITNLGNSHLQLNWPQGTLQGASNIVGPFSNVPGATQPYTISPTASQQFFRVRQ
jgi:hypothetical protein